MVPEEKREREKGGNIFEEVMLKTSPSEEENRHSSLESSEFQIGDPKDTHTNQYTLKFKN